VSDWRDADGDPLPETMTLKPDRLRWLLVFAICAGFVAGRTLSAHTSLLEIDLSSLSLARIHEAIDRDYPGSIEITDLIDNPTLEQLSVLLDTADC
jgi:hypothetical protein